MARDSAINSRPLFFDAGCKAKSVPTPLRDFGLLNSRQPTSKRVLRIDREAMPGLVALADELADGRESRYQVAQALSNHFYNDDSYTYTLNFDEVASMRNPASDPIEDFVTNHRHGHCEYFASALVLMLRSQGIPAHMAVGYHGGERNQYSGDIRVLQRHAHAWVEAYLGPDDIPPMLEIAMHGYSGGGWLRLDPTPPGADDLNGRNQFDDVLDYAQVLWNDYVLEMNPQRQRESLEVALGPSSKSEVSGVFSSLKKSVSRVVAAARNWVDGEWFSWRAGVLTSGVLLVGVAMINALYPVFTWLGALLRHRRRRRSQSTVRIAFYEQLERVLRKVPLQREPHQTQQEFAYAAAATLETLGLPPDVAQTPLLVAHAYYDVRFGNVPLDDQREAELRQAIHTLEEACRMG